MDISRHFVNLLLVIMLLTVPLPMVFSDQVEGIPEHDEIASRAIPWNQVVPGTEIKIAPGKNSNTSYYYPVPIGATVLSANVTFSNIPYTSGGKDYSREAWLNIGGETKEYVYGITGEGMFGTWGKQNRTRLGEKAFEDNLTATTRITGRFVLPKNATLSSAKLDIIGYQRGMEWKHYYISGTTTGDAVGYRVKDLDGTYVGMGDPGYSTSAGRVFLIYGNADAPIYTTLVSKTTRLDEFGFSISDPITITGTTPMKFAVGAPGSDTNRGYVELMNIATSYSSFQTLQGNLSGDRFGESIAAGDLDGDGDDELVVSAPRANSGKGSIHVYHQVQDPVNLTYDLQLLTVINGSVSDTSFGKTLSIGDINGDGKDDIAVGSDQDVYVFNGDSPIDPTFDANFDPLSSFPSSSIQSVKFLGKITGSTTDSLGIGLPDPSRGATLVYHGGASYDTTADVTFTAPNGVSYFGYDIDAGYDINGDSRNDIAIGAPGSGSTRGYVGIYSLSTPSAPLWSYTSTSTGDSYGSSVAFGTDLRKDGFGDLVSGAPKFSNMGNVFIHERYPLSQIPPNTPVVFIGPGDGTEAWRYPNDHLTDESTVTTDDLSDTINTFLRNANPSFNTPYEGFVYMDISIGMTSFSSIEQSNHFKVQNFEMVYSMQRSTGNIANSFNTYMDRPDPNLDLEQGIVKVPITYGGLSEGGIRIDDIEVMVDNVPKIEGFPGLIHIDEDSHIMDVLDLYLIFQDDLTPDTELIYAISPTGDNRSIFKAYIAGGRYVAIDLPNGSESANWSGDIKVTLTAADVNGGRSSPIDIDIRVDTVNDAPAIMTMPSKQIIQEAQFQYLPHAVDAENDDISYELQNEPENMTIDEQGTVIFKPNGWQIGENPWTLVLDDGIDKRYYEFSLDVVNINDAPLFSTPAPVGGEVLVGEMFSYQFKVYDLDPLDIVQFSLPEGPTGSSIAFELGLLTWTPIIFLDGPQKFRVRATDLEGAFSELIFHVNVTYIDNPPSITSTPLTDLYDFVEWTYNVWVKELDDDVVFVELYEGPPGMDYDDISESLVWTPTGYQLGSFPVSIRVTSTRYEIFQNFSVYVVRTQRNWFFQMDLSKDGMKVKGDLTIGGQVTVDPSVVLGLFIEVDDDEIYLPLESDGWTYTIKTKDYRDGELVISVKAYDGFENSTSRSITVIVANDEGKVNPVMYVLGVVVIIIILAITVFLVLLIIRKKRSDEEIKEKQKKLEEIEQSKTDVTKFIDACSDIKTDPKEDTMECFDMIDESRMAAIDNIFSPMEPGQQAPVQTSSDDEIPEDILQKAAVQESVLGPDPPKAPDDTISDEYIDQSDQDLSTS